MSGIVSYGAYVPFHRIQRAEIGRALGVRASSGERAVACYDEDSVTMAVEAARACLAAADSTAIRTLCFATTAPPYAEKLNAATIHAATRLPKSVRAFDLGHSVRAGIGSLLAAADAATAGASALAVSADIRIGAPEGSAEQFGGDAAVAFVVGSDGVLAEIEATHSETLEYLATWRTPEQRFAKSWEERFALTQAYVPLLTSAAKTLLSDAGLAPSDIAAVVMDAPHPRAVAAATRAVGFEPGQLVDDLHSTVGHSGAAQVGLMLASALDGSSAGDRILVLSVSDGVDGLLLRATPEIAEFTPARTVAQLVDSKRDNLSYSRYLKWRGLLTTEPPRRPDPQRPAAPPAFRSEDWKYGFVGSQCKECGTSHLPPQIVCVKCRAVDQMTQVPFAGRNATIRTFTVDRLAFTPQPPMVVAVIDFEGGGRYQSELTDCEPEKVTIGQSVEMTFRRLFTADGVHNYFWKARPAR